MLVRVLHACPRPACLSASCTLTSPACLYLDANGTLLARVLHACPRPAHSRPQHAYTLTPMGRCLSPPSRLYSRHVLFVKVPSMLGCKKRTLLRERPFHRNILVSSNSARFHAFHMALTPR